MAEQAQSGGRFRELSFLAKHSVIYGLGNVLSRIVAFIMLPIYTRHLSPFDYGVLEIVDTTTSMIGLVAGLGVVGAMSRFYFDYQDEEGRKRVVGTTFALTAAAVGIVLCVLLPLSSRLADLLFDRKSLAPIFNVALTGLGVGLFVDVAQSYLRIRQQSIWYVVVSLGNLLVGVGLNIYFIVFRGTGVIGIFYASLLAKLVVTLPLAIYILKQVGLHLDRALAARMYRYSLPLIPSDLANTVIGYSDRFFINHFLSTAAAGIYGLAQKLGTVAHLLITTPFLMTYLPRRFEIAKGESAPKTFASVFDYHMLVLVVFSLGLALFAHEILVVMTTPAYYAAADLIPVIAFSMVVLGMKYHFQFGILYCNRTTYQMYINLISATLHVSLNALLIRTLGVWGALLAFCVATLSNTVLSLLVARRLYPIPYDFGRGTRLAAVALLFGAVGMAFGHDGWTPFLSKVCLFLLLVPAIMLAGIVPKSEWQQVRGLLARFSPALR